MNNERDNAINAIMSINKSETNFRQVLGWSSLFDLDSGLRRTIAWYTQFFAHPQEAE